MCCCYSDSAHSCYWTNRAEIPKSVCTFFCCTFVPEANPIKVFTARMQLNCDFTPSKYMFNLNILSVCCSPAGTCNLLPTPRGTLGSCPSYQITEGTSCTMGCETANLDYYFLVGWAQATCSPGGVLTTAPDFICTRMFKLMCQTSRADGKKRSR
jgi:hypothetical protein